MNIVLIGMPASGKSTAGVILAKVLGMNFIDSDLIIQKREGVLLKEIIKSEGVEGFLKCEERVVLSIDEDNSVIATGGSVVYSDKGMKHLSKNGKVVYLKVDKKELFSRLKNINERGVVLRDNESPEEMFDKIGGFHSFEETGEWLGRYQPGGRTLCQRSAQIPLSGVPLCCRASIQGRQQPGHFGRDLLL